MKKIFNVKNQPRPSSLEFHIVSSEVMWCDNISGHQSSQRYIFGKKMAAQYMKRHHLFAGFYQKKSKKVRPTLLEIYLNKRNNKGLITEHKYYGTYQQWEMWELTKELEFYHTNCFYQLIWSIQYFFASIIDLFKKL